MGVEESGNPDSAAGALRKAEQAALAAERRLREAIDVLPEGIVFLDADGRYFLWNKRYAEIYRKSADLFHSGARLSDTFRIGIARGDYPEAIGREDEFFAERMALLDNPGTRHEQWLSDGRCILIEERKTQDGGTIGLRVDVTEMKQREQSFRLLFERNPVPLLVYDPASERIRSANQAAATLFGCTVESLADAPVEKLFAAADWEDARRSLGGQCAEGERFWRQLRSDGSHLETLLFAGEAMFDGCPSTIVSVIDVTERRRAEARVEHMARHDELTGLVNRARCREWLHERLEAGERIALLMIDLDHFKPVNDSFGHLAGDKLLAQAANRMAAITPPDAILARLGGDEFAIALPLGRRANTVTDLCATLIAALSEPFLLHGQEIHIGATMGMASAPDHATDVETLVRYADLALYAAKADRRGSWREFAADLDLAAQQRRKLENDFREAVRSGQLEVHYQPLINLRDGEIEGYEALLRWQHPTRGSVGPDEFIPLAEDLGLIDVVGQFVLQSACHAAARWPDSTKIAVNVSPVQFRSSNLLAITTRALAASGLKPSRLELEITEAVLMEKTSQVASIMTSLRALGIGISMDDFGTGYSSLSYLLSYPFTKLKIDKSFISRLNEKPNSQAIVRAIISLGESLGMTVTAEGIEQQEVLDYLRSQGCNQGQGFLFGEARPGESILPAEGKRRAA